MNIYQKLALALVGSSLSIGAIGAIPATAAILGYNFNFGGKTIGRFSFESTAVKGSPFEKVNLLSFTFNFKGNDFTQSQLSNGGVHFSNGNFRGLSGSVSGYDRTCMYSATNSYMQSLCQFSGSFGYYDNYADPNNPYYVFMGYQGRESFDYTPSYRLATITDSEGNTEMVPEPSTIGAFLGLGIFKWNQSRRKKLNKASN